MILTDTIKEKIKIASTEQPNEEVCGLIIKSGEYLDIYKCKNISSNKKEHFELNPFDYLKATKKGKVVGMWHSQEDEEPSVLDYIISSGHNIYSIVYSWKTDTFTEINKDIVKYSKYIGRHFELGKNDCYSLISDFYKNEYGIILNNYFRDDKTFDNEPDIINNHYRQEGFEKINLENIEIGDAIVFGLTKTSVHIGIWLGNNMFLHHERNKYSTVAKLTDSWKRKIVFCTKHKDKNV